MENCQSKWRQSRNHSWCKSKKYPTLYKQTEDQEVSRNFRNISQFSVAGLQEQSRKSVDFLTMSIFFVPIANSKEHHQKHSWSKPKNLHCLYKQIEDQYLAHVIEQPIFQIPDILFVYFFYWFFLWNTFFWGTFREFREMALLTVGPTFDQAKNKINKISVLILGIRNSEIWLFDDVSKV